MVAKDVELYWTSCEQCQLRARKRVTDRVPITPIPRAELPCQHIVIDGIEPIDPPSSKNHKYCLCVMDNCTRWPEVYPLRTLKASEICDNLLQLLIADGCSFCYFF